MIETVTLDQLRIFIAAADEGSFSAAGRKVRRAQSAISQTLATLEEQFGVKLFDRTRRMPTLTPHGQALLVDARAVVGDVSLLKAHAKHLAGGLEPELSIVIDVMFPMTRLTSAVTAFHSSFPQTPLRLYVETLGAVVQPLLDGRCTLGVLGTVTLVPQHFGQERLLDVPFIHVTSPRHPLASYGRPIPSAEVAKHVQLVLTDRSALTKGREFGVFSPRTWRLADLGAKHAFLRAALGWGGMPAELVQADIARGALVKIVLEDAPANFAMGMSVVYRTDAPPGTAGRWFINQLKRDPAVVGTKPGRHLTAAVAQKKRAKR